ncbi:MAG: L-threonylcarbamoyladenylate synthase [Thiolinea sp.]
MPARLSHSVDEAVATLRQGGLLAYPTEAVFGLGCDPGQLMAVQRLLGVKQRPAAKGLILLAAHLNQLSDYIPPLDEAMAARVLPTWPGPVTWLLPVHERVSPLLRGHHNTIAVRISDHPVCQQLCQKFGGPIVSTSANLAGEEPAITAQQVQEQLGMQIDLILDRPVGGRRRPSEIRNAVSNQIIRAG